MVLCEGAGVRTMCESMHDVERLWGCEVRRVSNLLLVAGYHIHDGRVSWLTLEVDLARLNK